MTSHEILFQIKTRNLLFKTGFTPKTLICPYQVIPLAYYY